MAGKVPVGTPAPHIRVPGFKARLRSIPSFLLMKTLGSSRGSGSVPALHVRDPG